MHSTRRRQKNSSLGLRVCAPWKDSLYYSGVVEAVKSRPTGESTYTVLFDDGYIAEVDEDELVGPGFATASSVHLASGQRVFITYNGREVAARVVKNKPDLKKVLVRVSDHGEHTMVMNRKDIRLLKAQKHRATLKLLEDSPPNECPIPQKIKPVENIESSMTEENLTRSEEMAALVLTALSISPILKEPDKGHGEEAIFSFSPDSGADMAWSYSPSNSPTISTSPNSLEEFQFPQDHGAENSDEGIGIDFVRRDRTRKRKNSTSSTGGSKKTLYHCTWPGCCKILSTAPGIIRHVRTIHLGPKRHSEDGFSDGEEEFYFTERETDGDEYYANDPFPHPLALSPTPTQSHFDMVKSPWTEPGLSPTLMENSPQNLHFNWDLNPTDHTQFVPSKAAAKPSSPTRTTQQYHTKKVRGDSKKCRKVYGMENRHLWCTQCRWKKACVRFTD
ncbi:zinc finger protein 704 [Nematostella vectensis]|uniref:zinc finger protein 704 n=1 Tax=Nematostella vectensis TaxID=45351 RepID=UPI0020773020|nr:zinc finger protein 704 [Nematostella vectensis]